MPAHLSGTYLTTTETAELLGLHPGSVRRWLCEPDPPIRPRSIGHRSLWLLQDVEELKIKREQR